MKSIWLVLLFFTMAAGCLPVVRFRKTIYYRFFLAVALIDPFIVAITYLFHVRSYGFLPFISAAILFALPTNSKKNAVASIISAIILITDFNENNWIPLLISTLNSLFVIYFFSDKIKEEFSETASVSIFLLVLWLEYVKDFAKIYLYYRHINVFIQLYVYFQIIGLITPLLVFYLGFETKYVLKKPLLKLIEKTISALDFSDRSKNKVKLISTLGRRELEILTHLSTGMPQKDIAAKLFIEKETVYFHTGNIKSKLNIDSTPALYNFADETKDIIALKWKEYNITHHVK